MSKADWRHRVAFQANLYLDIETDSAETLDEELERLAIQAVKHGSDLPLDEAGIDLPTVAGGRVYAEPNIDGGLENFSIEDCYEIHAPGTEPMRTISNPTRFQSITNSRKDA
jgi:hypothetical protein